MQSVRASWEAILHRRLHLYAQLTPGRRKRFLDYLGRFLGEKRFIAKARMVLDDEVRVTIAGTAVRLVLDLGIDHLRDVQHIVVYPHSVPLRGRLAAGATASNGKHVDLHFGWAQVLRGLEDPRDGYNVLLHELAHALDHHGGQFDGTPRLRPSQDYELWSHVLHRNFLDHWFNEAEQHSVLRSYARTSPAEFFAVATEAFFEKPEVLRDVLPDLYLKLKRFYGGDPDAA